MRMSCNGCRVLRKGCSEKCSIKPCLQWIKSPDAQSNATVFLAKFYGRAGLLNLINAGPEHLRPAIFRSLLYEACGRIVNPIYGSSGLLWSGNWQLCQAAVEAVLGGAPITKLSPDSAACTVSPSLKACDIRHVSKQESAGAVAGDLHKVKSRGRFKRTAAGKAKQRAGRDSGLSQHADEQSRGGESGDANCASVETVETSLAKPEDESDVELELTLGWEPMMRHRKSTPAAPLKPRVEWNCN
nr:LOB domain-containing protein 41-like [Ipomoea batatas]